MSILSNIFSVKNEYLGNKKRKVIRVMGVKFKLKAQKLPVYRTVNYIIQMLKEYGVKNIISSPGAQNSMFNLLVQDDEYFNCYSVTDERSAAYMALGMAEELNEPVVITCTGSTASRNWIPALTEAYYKNIPIIAMPFYNRLSNEFNLAAQYTNRKITHSDIKSIQVKLPEIADEVDKKQVLTYINTALATAKFMHKPVIIESPSNLFFNDINDFKYFPKDVWHTQVIEEITNEEENFADKNTAIFIGSHGKFSQEEENAISEFAKSWNIPVFCDHTSSYHGANKILTAKSIICRINLPDLIIDIGGVTGDYFVGGLFAKCLIYRVTPPLCEHTFKFRFDKPVVKTFIMPEKLFFQKYKNKSDISKNYYEEVKNTIENTTYPELPLCNYLIVQNLSKYIPEGSILHHGVSNTKRGMNYYDFSESIDTSCNVGVCGIDGAVSTLVGHSLAAPDKKVFGIMGDLTFFYDMSVLQNRDIKNNLRIILINNNKGVEFKVGNMFPNVATEPLIGAAYHHTTANGWAQSCGFHYMSANTKEDFLAQIKDFCTKDFDKPVMFEVFTKDEDEINAFTSMININNEQK